MLTNGHVVRGARKVTIGLADQRKFAARVIGTDPLTDVGVVRFEKPPPGLVAARLGDSDRLRIGEWTIAVGSPLGMDQTVTVGIISGVGATGSHFRFESGERVRKYIQTDAKINPGNSGGPLVNLEGEVVGINTLINVGPGGSYGFAIPINQAWQVAGLLIKDGHVRYPYIGVAVSTLSDVPKALRDRVGTNLPPEGALVSSVAPGGPADGAGLAAGDVITKIAGRVVKTGSDVVAGISGATHRRLRRRLLRARRPHPRRRRQGARLPRRAHARGRRGPGAPRPRAADADRAAGELAGDRPGHQGCRRDRGRARQPRREGRPRAGRRHPRDRQAARDQRRRRRRPHPRREGPTLVRITNAAGDPVRDARSRVGQFEILGTAEKVPFVSCFGVPSPALSIAENVPVAGVVALPSALMLIVQLVVECEAVGPT